MGLTQAQDARFVFKRAEKLRSFRREPNAAAAPSMVLGHLRGDVACDLLGLLIGQVPRGGWSPCPCQVFRANEIGRRLRGLGGTLADHQCRSRVGIGPIHEREGHQNGVQASQHQAATAGSPSVKL